jgi:hypothetical protein
MSFLPQATDSQMKFHMQLFQVQADYVTHLHVLEVLPRPFDRVEVRGIGGHCLHVNLPARRPRQEFLYLGPAVDRRTIPDHQQPLPRQAEEMPEERHAVQAVQRLLAHQRVHLALRGQAAHDGEVVPALPLMDDWRQSCGSIGLNHSRQE